MPSKVQSFWRRPAGRCRASGDVARVVDNAGGGVAVPPEDPPALPAPAGPASDREVGLRTWVALA